jgi:hypothetical protein
LQRGRTIHILAVPVVAGCLLILAGCLSGVGRRSPHEQSDAQTTPLASVQSLPPSSNQPFRILHMRFEIRRFDMPAEPSRYSPKIWNHVDELRMDAELVAALARNGVRVGAAPRSSWPAIYAILEAAGAEVQQQEMEVRGKEPLEIVLTSRQEPETIFAYDRKNRLSGRTVPEGDRMLRIDYLLHPELSGRIDLNVEPEIRRDLGSMQWQNVDGVITRAPAYEWLRFESLSVPITLNPDEFLVIGSSERAENEYLVGGRFFNAMHKGKRYETVLCITPRPYEIAMGGAEPR